MKKRFLASLLCLCMVLTLLPTVVFAVGDEAAIQLGVAGTADQEYIYYGTYGVNSIKWRVLDADQTNFDGDDIDIENDAGMFLLSDVLLGTGTYGGVIFDDNNSNAYQDSNAQEWCNTFETTNLSAQELTAILSATKSDEAFTSSTLQVSFAASTNILSGDQVFFLSAQEAEHDAYGFANDTARVANYGLSAGVWWLRSPCEGDGRIAGVVNGVGGVDYSLVSNGWAARPAFNLDLDSVLFTSAAVGGKSVSGMSSAMTAVAAKADVTEWKATLLDDTRSFAISNLAWSDDTVTFDYSGAETGTNEYISAVIVDEGEVAYYGRITNLTDATNDVDGSDISITLPQGVVLDENTTLQVFNEQFNGDDDPDTDDVVEAKTDLASRPITVKIPEPVIQLGACGIEGWSDATQSYDYIYYGIYSSNPIKWRVLDDAGNGDSYTDASDKTYTGGSMFLLSEALLGTGTYGNVIFEAAWNSDDNDGQTNPNEWQHSDAQVWCKDFDGESTTTEGEEGSVPDAFSSSELAAILSTTKSDVAFTSSRYSVPFSASTSILNGDKVFFLSAKEAENSTYGFTNDAARVANYGVSAGVWWLRSPIERGDIFAGVVYDGGSVADRRVDIGWAARPAFNLNLNSVLFTSAAEGGKSVSGMSSGLTEIPKELTDTWKATVLDSSRSFAINDIVWSGDSVTFDYSGAETGTNEYISAAVVDNGEIIYYGRIERTDGETGSATVNIPNGVTLDANTTLQVFNEQYNGGENDDTKVTDYASAMVEVALPITITGVTLPTNAPVVGTALTATVAPSTATVTYEWLSSSDGNTFTTIPSATVASYTPVSGDVGKYIQVKATGTGAYNGMAVTTTTAKVAAPSGGGSTTDYYTLTFNTNGGSDISAVRRAEYSTINLASYIPTREGYTFTGWYSDEALTEKIESIRLTKNTTIYAGWSRTNPDTGAWDNPFTDVSETDWFYEDVALCNLLGLMEGTSDTTFSPYATTTRGMIVTILWRLEESPVVDFAMTFEDVPEKYYTEAVRWAASEGIVGGYSAAAFGPEDAITREQLATILYNYAKYKGEGFSGSWYFLLDFPDSAGVSTWADEAMHWCVMNDIIRGSDGKLMPKDGAQRCQAAAMLIRFLNSMNA